MWDKWDAKGQVCVLIIRVEFGLRHVHPQEA